MIFYCEECDRMLDLDIDPFQTGKFWYHCDHCGNEGTIELEPDPMDVSHAEDEWRENQ